MQGKILADGLISGVDGKRYTFTASDLKNAQGKSADAFIGCEVDFIGENGKASEIYLTKTPIAQDFSSTLLDTKKKAFSVVVCLALTYIPIIDTNPLSFILYIGAFIGLFLLTLNLREVSQSTTLLKNFIIATLIAILSVLAFGAFVVLGAGTASFVMFAPAGGGVPESANTAIIGALGASIFNIIISVAAFVLVGIFLYRYFKELGYITNERFFMVSFWCGVAGAALDLLSGFVLVMGGFVVANLFYYAGFAAEIIGLILFASAWVRTKEIRKSYSAVS